jgi:hypothetical protein
MVAHHISMSNRDSYVFGKGVGCELFFHKLTRNATYWWTIIKRPNMEITSYNMFANEF